MFAQNFMIIEHDGTVRPPYCCCVCRILSNRMYYWHLLNDTANNGRLSTVCSSLECPFVLHAVDVNILLTRHVRINETIPIQRIVEHWAAQNDLLFVFLIFRIDWLVMYLYTIFIMIIFDLIQKYSSGLSSFAFRTTMRINFYFFFFVLLERKKCKRVQNLLLHVSFSADKSELLRTAAPTERIYSLLIVWPNRYLWIENKN